MFEATKLVAASALAVFTLSAAAQADTRPYISLGGNIIAEDSDRQSDMGYGGKIAFGKRMNSVLGFELQGFYNEFGGSSDPAEWEEYGVGADLNVFMGGSERFAPYLLVGAGVMRSEATANSLLAPVQSLDQRRAFANVGAGFKIFPDTGVMGFTADYRFRAFDTNVAGIGDIGDHIVSVGLLFPVGSKSAGAAPESTTVVDTDGDGVPDDRDLCPGTPAGVAVDARGCPRDSDGDGVPDYLDKCPNTAAGVTVDKDGCPVDAAGPNRTFENVNFEFDRSELTDYARGILDAASTVINQLSGEHAGLVVQIDGHTDSVGSPGYNMALSERRANSVKQYLVRKGVDAQRIETQSYGLTKPIATNDTDAGRALNRRAEVRTRAE
ncbi:OmpA family protein [Polycyclovorans algicola]|uniref:OmpA family protein n=1 Tax=Polycyclovorans algicola TaxID=616992 RepID=UPI0006935B76|nr:OmpA family protein [Polycyclovorans algicola]